MLLDPMRCITTQVEQFQVAAHEILSKHETASKSRVISIEKTRRQLQGLTLRQHDLLREALDCIEFGLYRAAHVSAWQAYADLQSEKLASDGFLRVSKARPKWPKFSSVQDLREYATEHELILLARELGLIARSEVRILHGMLSERNECGHPSRYRPGLNESLGYVSKLINRMEELQAKSI